MKERLTTLELTKGLWNEFSRKIIVRARLIRSANGDSVFSLWGYTEVDLHFVVVDCAFHADEIRVGTPCASDEMPGMRLFPMEDLNVVESHIKTWREPWKTTQHAVFLEERGNVQRLLSRSHISVFVPMCVIAEAFRCRAYTTGQMQEAARVVYCRLNDFLVESRKSLRQVLECP